MKIELRLSAFGFALALVIGPSQSCVYDVPDSASVESARAALELQLTAEVPSPGARRGVDSLAAVRSPAPPSAVLFCNSPCTLGRGHADCIDSCSRAMAHFDPFCMHQGWDELCVQNAEWICNVECGCTHALDQTGLAQSPEACDCAGSVCRLDPYCCSTEWDQLCVNAANSQCEAGAW